MEKTDKIYIAGHKGLVGSAVHDLLKLQGYTNLVYRTHAELELTDRQAVRDFFDIELPDVVILAAAKVGGIMANNTYPAEFIYENLEVQNNVIHESFLHDVRKLLFLGSVCIYPRLSAQPIKEEYLLTGALEPTNEPYAIAKIAGMKMCQSYNRQYGTNYIAVMPTNLYGRNDSFNLQNSHVLPAMIRKFYEAKLNGNKEVTLWGSGSPTREFMHVDDMADACVYLLNRFSPTPEENESGQIFFNIGTGVETSIKELAEIIAEVVGYNGQLVWDTSKPDGMPRRLLDVRRLKNLGWQPKVQLMEGIARTYDWFVNHYEEIRQ